MKYQAIAIGVKVNERSVQIYGGDEKTIRDWAQNTADSHGCQVEIRVTTEVLMEVVGPKEEVCTKQK